MSTDHSVPALGVTRSVFQWNDLECCLVETGDESFSLRYRTSRETPWTEPMHSSKGAWSETLYVYEPALRASLEIPRPHGIWSVASVGLGLGYNELLSAGMALKYGISTHSFRLTSFESQDTLREFFRLYFIEQHPERLPRELVEAQKRVLECVCSHLQLDRSTLLAFLRELERHEQLQLNGALRASSTPSFREEMSAETHVCVLFDAFSPESSPDLWQESLLEEIVAKLCATDCVFASYASRTALKKILKKSGFILEKRTGFAGKRELTFAQRKKQSL